MRLVGEVPPVRRRRPAEVRRDPPLGGRSRGILGGLGATHPRRRRVNVGGLVRHGGTLHGPVGEMGGLPRAVGRDRGIHHGIATRLGLLAV